MNSFGFGQNFMFTMVPLLFTIMFCLIFGIIIFRIIKGMVTLHKNYQAPELSVQATIVTKRADIRRRMNTVNESAVHTISNTWYYITFEVESGDRMEFQVSDQEYGLLVEGDQGKLIFQGTSFKSFVRQ